ncbi:MAG TPA: outer membrane beta-barrel protein [Candidatus Acidoferrum sp.]|jgi:opacity protein-like surface antigen|nr:outer membrane beta-barrel protein [Candidatus Acidoferrum sp.]
MTNGRFGGVLLSAAGLVLGAANGFAQEGSLGEVGSYTGVSMGGLGGHPVVGGTTGIVTKWAVGQIDASYMPIGNRTLRHRLEPTSKSQLFDFNFTVQIQVPVHHRVVPYFVTGPAMLFNRYQLQLTSPQGVPFLSGQQDFKFGWENGGGLRYYIADNWGVRTEYRYTITAQNFGRITAGVFYQFSAPWPLLSRGGGKRGQGAPY